jgi:hypothetical protein
MTHNPDNIPLSVTVKQALYAIGPATRVDLAKHLGVDDKKGKNDISKALNSLAKQGEIVKLDGDKPPYQWSIDDSRQGGFKMSAPAPDKLQPVAVPAAVVELDDIEVEPKATSATDPEQDGSWTIEEIVLKLTTPMPAPVVVIDLDAKLAHLEKVAAVLADDYAEPLLEIRRDLQALTGALS